MPRMTLAVFLAVGIASAAIAQDQQGPLQQISEINAADYIRGVLANDRYDPEDRQRARNYGPEFEASTHWRSSIFDGRRTRATRGTGLTLPDLPAPDSE